MSTAKDSRAPPPRAHEPFAAPIRKVPTAQEFFAVPARLIRCLVEIAPMIEASGAWWCVSGDLAENLLDIHVRPVRVEILTTGDGVERILAALSKYNPEPSGLREERLDREAEIDGKRYPVYVRSNRAELRVKEVPVVINGDYQMKVGEWEWGDALYFRPVLHNVAGVLMPVFPLKVSNEIYRTLGWMDRARLITDAASRPIRTVV